MLIPIKKRTLENLIDEIGELQADIAALDAKLKKKKSVLKDEMIKANVANAEGRRFKVTWVSRQSLRTDWKALSEALNIHASVIGAYSKVTRSEYPLVKIRRDAK